MKQRGERIRLLEADLEAAGRTPAGKAELLATVERALRQKLGDLREALTRNPSDCREVFLDLLPEGVWLKPEVRDTRRVWVMRAMAQLGECSLKSDPTGIFFNRDPDPSCFMWLSLPALPGASALLDSGCGQ